MNKANCYCVYDKKSEIYNTPYFIINDQVAKRQLKTVVDDPTSMISKFPLDYILYKVGEFDMLTGKMVPLISPVEVCPAISLVEVKK